MSDPAYEAFLEIVHPQDRALVDQAVKQALEEGSDYRVEFRAILPDGTVRWAKTYGEVLSDEAGKPTRMVGVVMGNSSRQATEDQSR
jgi:PAS domain S-box-containing protein